MSPLRGTSNCCKGEGREGSGGRGGVEDEGSSHGRNEAQATEEVARDDPIGAELAGDELVEDEPARIEALYAVVAEAQEEEGAEEAEQPEEEWLAAGPQAPKPVLDQRPHRRVPSRGAVVPDPAPAVKKIPPAKQLSATGVDSSSQSGSSSSHSSSSSESPVPQQGLKLPGSSVPPPQKRSRAPSPPVEFELNSMLIDEEEEEEEGETLVHRTKRLRRAEPPKTMEDTALAGSSTNDPTPSPQLSPGLKVQGWFLPSKATEESSPPL
nr:translation initiation factor IF-2-like [Aegilops tauschii subsp. strangulata]